MYDSYVESVMGDDAIAPTKQNIKEDGSKFRTLLVLIISTQRPTTTQPKTNKIK